MEDFRLPTCVQTGQRQIRTRVISNGEILWLDLLAEGDSQAPSLELRHVGADPARTADLQQHRAPLHQPHAGLLLGRGQALDRVGVVPARQPLRLHAQAASQALRRTHSGQNPQSDTQGLHLAAQQEHHPPRHQARKHTGLRRETHYQGH